MPHPSMHASRFASSERSAPSHAPLHLAKQNTTHTTSGFPKFAPRPAPAAWSMALPEAPPLPSLETSSPPLPPAPLRMPQQSLAPLSSAADSIPWQEDGRFGIVLMTLLVAINIGIGYGLSLLPALPSITSTRSDTPSHSLSLSDMTQQPITLYHAGQSPTASPRPVPQPAPSQPDIVHVLGGPLP